MREILFHGKRLDNGEWVEGFYVGDTGDGCHEICDINSGTGHRVEVDPATAGQYAGMTDKNGKKIFDGHIVRDMNGVIYPVVYSGTGFYLRYDPPHAHGRHYDLIPLCNYWCAHGAVIEIIGNIHDNTELLEGSAGNG